MVGLTGMLQKAIGRNDGDYGRSAPAFQTVKSTPEISAGHNWNPIDLCA
jgi:hypothetical protein